MFSVLSLLSSDEAEIDIVKEDLCEHVMLHVEGRVPRGLSGLLGRLVERRLRVVCHGIWEVSPVIGRCGS
jgi:hypothetical protein